MVLEVDIFFCHSEFYNNVWDLYRRIWFIIKDISDEVVLRASTADYVMY